MNRVAKANGEKQCMNHDTKSNEEKRGVWHFTKTIRQNFSKKKALQLLALTVCIIAGCATVYQNEIVPRMEDSYTEDPIEASADKDDWMTLKQGDVVVQEFAFPVDQMIGVSFELYSDTSKNRGSIHMALYDAQTNELLGETTADASDIDNMEKNLATDEDIYHLTVGMPTIISGNAGRQMRAELSVDSLSKKANVLLMCDEDGSAAIRTYSYHYRYWQTFFTVGVVLVCILLYGGYVMLFLLKSRPERVFLLSGAIMAIFISILLPPLTVPDEMVHITTSYYYSNKIFGIEEPSAETIYVRQTDKEAFEKLQTTPTLKEYDYFMWNIGRHPKSTELVEYGGTQESKNWSLYLPTVLGVTLGRLLGLNGITTIYLGRGFAVLLYLICFYYAIKKIPKGKAAVFLFALSPMVMQQCCSFSYDAIPIELTVLLLTELFQILYTDKKVEKADVVLLCVLLFFLASSKGGVYLPECLLVLLIPAEKFADLTWKSNKEIAEKITNVNNGNVFSANKKRRIVRLLFAAAAVLGFAVNTVPYLSLVLGFSETTTKTQAYSDSLGCYTISEVLGQPIHTIYVLINTILMYADYFFQGMYIQPLGWLNIAINPFTAYLLAALMILGVTYVQGEKTEMTKKQKWCLFLAAFVTIAMSTASMLVSWTTSGNKTVTGLQGRYFTPIFLYLLFLFRTKFIRIAKRIDNELMFAGLGVCVLVINNILSSVQAAN